MTTAAFTAQLAAALQGPYPAPEAAAMAALVAETLLGLSPLQRRMQATAPVPAEVAAQLPALVARLLDEVAEVPGAGGVMLTFDHFVEGIENFGTRIQPLMRSRRHIAAQPVAA